MENVKSHQRSTEQEIAEQAWKAVLTMKSKPDETKYRSLVRGATADLQISGLGQFLAFLKSKGKGEHIALYNHIKVYLSQKNSQCSDPLEWIATKASSTDYRKATTETMAYLLWVKRFAESELKKG